MYRTKFGSGKPRTERIAINIDALDEMVLNDEDAPQLIVGLQCDRLRQKLIFTVYRCSHADLGLEVRQQTTSIRELHDSNCIISAQMQRPNRLLTKFPESCVPFIFYFNEGYSQLQRPTTDKMMTVFYTAHESN